MVVHGTTQQAWQLIGSFLFDFPFPISHISRLATRPLPKMSRNHVHLAQNVLGHDVMSGRYTPLGYQGAPEKINRHAELVTNTHLRKYSGSS